MSERYTKSTIDNWESYIVDNETGKEYGCNIDPLLQLLNAQDKLIKQNNKDITNLIIENQKLKDKNKKFKEELHEILEELREILKYDQR